MLNDSTQLADDVGLTSLPRGNAMDKIYILRCNKRISNNLHAELRLIREFEFTLKRIAIRAKIYNISRICVHAPTEANDVKLEDVYDKCPAHDAKIVL